MKPMMHAAAYWVRGLLIGILAAVLNCARDQVTGTGVNTGNSTATGVVIDSKEQPRIYATVSALPPDWSPLLNPSTPPGRTTLTDSTGRFTLEIPPSEVLNLEITVPGDLEKLLRCGIQMPERDTSLGTLRLRQTGTVRVPLADSIVDRAHGMYVPGATLRTTVTDTDRGNGYVLLAGVPAGTVPMPVLVDASNQPLQTHADSILVSPNDTTDVTELSFHVSPQGDDGTGLGTRHSPWRTISHAAAHVPATEAVRLVVAAGTYVESTCIELPPNASLIGAGATETTVRPVRAVRACIRSVASGTHLDTQLLADFTVDGADRAAAGIVVVGRSHLRVKRVSVTACDSSGIVLVDDTTRGLSAAPARYLDDVAVTDCMLTHTADSLHAALEVSGLRNSSLTHLSIVDSTGAGIRSPSGYCRAVKITNCRVSTAAGPRTKPARPAIDLRRCFDDCEIAACTLDYTIAIHGGDKRAGLHSIAIHHNRISLGYDVVPASAIRLHASDMAVHHNAISGTRFPLSTYYANVSNLAVHHNVCTFDSRQGEMDGPRYEIHLAGETMDSIRLYNNVFHMMTDTMDGIVGIRFSGTGIVRNVHVANNVFWSERTSGPVAFMGPSDRLITIENLRVEHNLFTGVDESSATEAVFSGNLTQQAPGFLLQGEKPDPFYRPHPDDNLRNAGINVGLSYAEDAPDIGAYEYE